MQAKATLRFARVAPTKVRQITRGLRGLSVDAARDVLDLETKGAARDVRKTLDSAVANAEHNHDMDPDDLVVEEVVVEEGPVLRRFRPRAMGRATRIRKRTTHLTVIVSDGQPEPADEPVASNTAAAGDGDDA